MSIGERIRELRKELGMTQPQLAARVNVANSVISNWESGKNIPRSDYVVKLARIFDVSADYILGLEKESESGEAVPSKGACDEAKLLAAYRALSEDKRAALLKMLDTDGQ